MIRFVTLALMLAFGSAQGQVWAASTQEPRLGIDYEILPVPQPTYGQGKFEVAEVFSYRCHFCAAFQPFVNQWRKSMPAGARWEYVPAVFGGSWDTFARAYFAAEIMGVQKKTHDAVFDEVFVKKSVKAGTPEEVADMYGKLGVDRARFLSTMQSFAVTGKLARARQFALRAGVDKIPTIVLNGKYRILVTNDRSYAGAIATLNFLLAKEGVR